MSKCHKYTEEQIQFLRENIAGRSYNDMTRLFNERFGLALNAGRIKSALDRYKLRNGRDGRFRRGRTPANKGKKRLWQGGVETQFKPGHMPNTYKPVGAERISSDGYAMVKVADPNKWRAKHVVMWEQVNGPVPLGHVVIFANGNRLDINLDNLILISRRELVVLNKFGLISADAELTRSGVAVADIYLKISERKKRLKGKSGRE